MRELFFHLFRGVFFCKYAQIAVAAPIFFISMQLTRIYTKIVRSHSNVNEKQRTKWSKSQNKRRKKNEVKNNGWERERERGTKIAIIIVMNEEKRNWGLCPIVFNVVVIFVVDTRFPLVFSRTSPLALRASLLTIEFCLPWLLLHAVCMWFLFNFYALQLYIFSHIYKMHWNATQCCCCCTFAKT